MATTTAQPQRSLSNKTPSFLQGIKHAWKVGSWTILAVSGIVGLLVGGIAIAAYVRGEQMMIITSGSMAPTIPVAAVVFVDPVPFYDLKIGDVVTYASSGSPNLTTHRIVDSRRIDGTLFFQTQGDANRTPDPNLTPATAVAGRVDVTIPTAGRLLDAAASPLGRLLLIVLPVLILTARQLRHHFGHHTKTAAHDDQPPQIA